jgi:hypothetical protein
VDTLRSSDVSCHRGEVHLFGESLRLTPHVEQEWLSAQCLWGMAAVAAAQGKPSRAARLWGAAAALGNRLHLPPYALHPPQEQLLSPARERLGQDAFDAEWTKGHAMRRDDAVAYALVTTDLDGTKESATPAN